MGNKLTNQDVDLFTAGGSNYLTTITSADFNTEVLTELCKSISDRHDSEKPLKVDLKWTTDMIPHVLGDCRSGLNMTVFSVDGTNYLGEFNNGELSVTTKTKQTDGATEWFRWNQAMGTTYQFTLDKFIIANADLFQRTLTGDLTDLEVQVVLTAGAINASLPMTISAGGHSFENDSEQLERVTFKNRGTPTSVSGDALFVDILVGDAFLTWAVQTGGGNYLGNAIIESARYTISNGALDKTNYGFANQGQPTFSAAA